MCGMKTQTTPLQRIERTLATLCIIAVGFIAGWAYSDYHQHSADLNHDGVVNNDDATLLFAQWSNPPTKR